MQGSLIFFPVQIVDPKTGEEKKVVISVDDGIRPGTTASGLAKLKPVFRKDGTTTAGIAALLAFFFLLTLLLQPGFVCPLLVTLCMCFFF